MSRLGLVLLIATLPASAQDEAGKIMRPAPNSHLPSGNVDVVARAAEGAKLSLDGRPLSPDEPFPGVFHTVGTVDDGIHELLLEWPGGQSSLQFYVGSQPPTEFRQFVHHPPETVACNHCHGLSRRGRFRFTGGCFACHDKSAFVAVHSHEPHVLESCGQCHNAHGSAAAKHLVMSKDLACKQCHN